MKGVPGSAWSCLSLILAYKGQDQPLLSFQSQNKVIGVCRVLCVNVALTDLSVASVLCFLEYLGDNTVLVCMVVTSSALKAMPLFIVFLRVFEHLQMKYFVRALNMNLPLTVSWKTY